MKNFIITATLLAIVGFGMTGCKDEPPLTPNYGTDYGDLQYTLDGIADTTMEQTDTVSMRLYVNRSAGKFEDVRLSLAEGPTGLKVRFVPDEAIAPFNTVMWLDAKQVDVGEHTVKIMGASQTTGLRYFDLKLTVTPYTNPALALEGDFDETRKCSKSGDTTIPVTVTPVTGSPNKITISGLWMGGGNFSVVATTSPVSKTITIPTQYSYQLRFEGTGTYSKGRFELAYSVKDTSSMNIINDNCTSIFEQR